MQPETTGTISKISTEYAAQFKLPGHQSKLSPAIFAQLSPEEKDEMLAESFRILTTTVDSSKHTSKNALLNQLVAKTVGACANDINVQYEGEFIDGVANGKGKVRWANQSIYEGPMLNGKIHGEGKITEYGANGFNGKVTFLNGKSIGRAVKSTNNPAVIKVTNEHGFNQSGNFAGPTLSVNEVKDISYEDYSNGKIDGPVVIISHKKDIIEYKVIKDGKEVVPSQLFVEAAKLSQEGGEQSSPTPAPVPATSANQSQKSGLQPSLAQAQAPAPEQAQAQAPAPEQAPSNLSQKSGVQPSIAKAPQSVKESRKAQSPQSPWDA
jgi:hypothetical protein